MFKLVTRKEWEDLQDDIYRLKRGLAEVELGADILNDLCTEMEKERESNVRISPRTGKPVRKYNKKK